MPYSIEWLIEGRVILERAFGDLTVDDLVHFNADVTREINERGDAPVHVIADLTKLGRFPLNLREVMGSMRNTATEQMGWMVAIANNPAARFIASMVFQVAKMKLRMFKSMDEAVEFLADMDDTIAAEQLANALRQVQEADV